MKERKDQSSEYTGALSLHQCGLQIENKRKKKRIECHQKVSLVYKSEFQDSQSYSMKLPEFKSAISQLQQECLQERQQIKAHQRSPVELQAHPLKLLYCKVTELGKDLDLKLSLIVSLCVYHTQAKCPQSSWKMKQSSTIRDGCWGGGGFTHEN